MRARGRRHLVSTAVKCASERPESVKDVDVTDTSNWSPSQQSSSFDPARCAQRAARFQPCTPKGTSGGPDPSSFSGACESELAPERVCENSLPFLNGGGPEPTALRARWKPFLREVVRQFPCWVAVARSAQMRTSCVSDPVQRAQPRRTGFSVSLG